MSGSLSSSTTAFRPYCFYRRGNPVATFSPPDSPPPPSGVSAGPRRYNDTLLLRRSPLPGRVDPILRPPATLHDGTHPPGHLGPDPQYSVHIWVPSSPFLPLFPTRPYRRSEGPSGSLRRRLSTSLSPVDLYRGYSDVSSTHPHPHLHTDVVTSPSGHLCPRYPRRPHTGCPRFLLSPPVGPVVLVDTGPRVFTSRPRSVWYFSRPADLGSFRFYFGSPHKRPGTVQCLSFFLWCSCCISDHEVDPSYPSGSSSVLFVVTYTFLRVTSCLMFLLYSL